jgi:hypothetical protein
MKCVVIQRRLLGSERPDQPSADVREHLAGCLACRDWQRRLLKLEQQIARLPVPTSTARDRLIQEILQPAGPAAPPVRLPQPRSAGTLKERGLQKMALAFALAAALACFAIGWWAWPHQSVSVAMIDPLLQRREQLAARLAGKVLPREQVQVLADVADELHGEAQANVDNPEHLAVVAKFYEEVVREKLLALAQDVPVLERPAILTEIANRLGRTESAAERRAAEIRLASEAASDSLRSIASTARQGAVSLRDLARG